MPGGFRFQHCGVGRGKGAVGKSVTVVLGCAGVVGRCLPWVVVGYLLGSGKPC